MTDGAHRARDKRGLSWVRLALLAATVAAVYLVGGSLFSMARTQAILDPIMTRVFQVRDGGELFFDIAILRLAIHFLEYFVVFLVANRLIGLRPLSALLLCVALAAGDEGHQYFLPDRTFAVRDLVLDTAGAATALVVTLAFARRAALRRRVAAAPIESS